MMQEDNHIFQGMRRSSHPIKQDRNFLWDAHNIRITTRDKDTMMSITNERSTKLLYTFLSGEKYIGHTTIGNYLILLVHTTDTDIIYRIELSTVNDLVTPIILYKGNLNFNPLKPAQIIADYESDLIQKVYWVDGLNSPRVINITKPELVYPDIYVDGHKKPSPDKLKLYNEEGSYSSLYKDSPFDFVQELQLKEDIRIKRLQSNVGIFPSGVIQYALTYLHKYGQESNIFYTSQPLYLSYPDRGGGPEDRVSCSFELNISNIDTKFQYIRVYSIIRTSIDATPTVKRVSDIDISGVTNGSINIIDNNTTGDVVDPTYLLYVGGKDIIANCIATKDNTLFLGNISYKRKSIRDLELEDAGFKLNQSKYPLNLEVQGRDIDVGSSNKSYIFKNQLSENTCTFKNGETYRLGCRFQYKNGEWSEPIWIKDEVYRFDNLGYDDEQLHLGKISGIISDALKNKLTENGYRKIQSLIVKPSYKDRTILAQGILCPTVGQVGNRATTSGVWAQSSWLIRPFAGASLEGGTLGTIAADVHNLSLYFGRGRAVELQNMAIENANNDLSYQLSYDQMTSGLDLEDINSYYGAFVVDQSIVTMHSPDIEFGNVSNVINSGVKLSLNKIGEIEFTSNDGYINIQTSSPVADPDSSGFINQSTHAKDGSRSLVSGLFYEDSTVLCKDGKTFETQKSPRLWMTYLWHRAGSLNNDIARPADGGARTAELKKKSIINFKVSNISRYYTRDEEVELPITDIKSFNSNEVSLLKLNISTNKTVSYYGNVDTLIPSYQKYGIVSSFNKYSSLDPSTYTFNGYVYTDNIEEVFSLKADKLRGVIRNNAYLVKGRVQEGVIPYKGEGFSTTVNLAEKGAIITLDIVNGKFTGGITLTSQTTDSDGNIVPSGFHWDIVGTTDYTPNPVMVPIKWGTPPFSSPTTFIADDADTGETYETLKNIKDGIRLKYKSAPHAVISLKQPLTRPYRKRGILYLTELRQEVVNRYGGQSEEALLSNLWIPAGPALNIEDGVVEWLWGDTWFQRYDFLKTYPFTFEDANQVTEIGSFFCETRINIDGRYDKNRESVSFSLSPTNFNLINPVYSQLDTFFTSRKLDEDYYKTSNYPAQFLWTSTKVPSSETDLWTNLHVASSYDVDGRNGSITAIQPYNDILIGFQDRAVFQILFNSRVQIQASDGVPIEIANSRKVDGVRIYNNSIGCQDKFNIVSTATGIYFIDNNNFTVYKFNGEFTNIGAQLGNLYWFRDNYQNSTWSFRANAPYNPGIRLFYDPKYQDVYFVPALPIKIAHQVDSDKWEIIEDPRTPKNDALCFSEQLNQFTSMLSYNGAVMFPFNSKFYSLANNSDGNLALWENFAGDGYNNIFGKIRPFNFSFISNDNPLYTKIFDTIELRADKYNASILVGDKYSTIIQEGQPLDYIRVVNEYQDTNDMPFNHTNLRKKFRVWRLQIPRNFGTRERIRNPWTKITLGCNNPNNNLTIVHDLTVKYTI